MDASLIQKWAAPGTWLDFLLPPLCAGCGEYTEDRALVCHVCQRTIREFGMPSCLRCGTLSERGTKCQSCKGDSPLLFAHGEYSDPLREIIIQCKFKGVTSPVDFVASRISAVYGERLREFGDARLVPIPLHPSREFSRGYNQATLFARALSVRLGITVDTDILFRTEKRKPQSELKEAERGQNIAGVFAVDEDYAEGSRQIILVDDVVTTGHTVGEATRELSRHGIAVCAVVAMARAQ